MTRARRKNVALLGIVGVVVAAAAVRVLNDGDDKPREVVAYAPKIDPAAFTTKIDNPFLPLTPGAKWVYEAKTKEGAKRVVVEVTDKTRTVMGVPTVVVRDTETLDGEVHEDTFDWFAQDKDGNVWYFGEDTKEYKGGKVDTTAGSWEAGVDGAQPGIVMKGNPQVGDRYRLEYYAGEAEDTAKVVSLGEKISVPYGDFDDVLKTNDINPLEGNAKEYKYYARGVGLLLEHDLSDGERMKLIKRTLP